MAKSLIIIGIIILSILICILKQNIKYKKQIILSLTLLLICSIFVLKSTKVNRKIAKNLGIKIPYTLDFDYTDSHGGFHGDGIAIGRSKLKDKDIKKLLKDPKGHWNKTPLPSELNIMFFGNESYHSDLAKKLKMKHIENGYWIYIDRFGNKMEYLKGEEIDRHSGNYSIGLLDLDGKILYYIKFDS